MQAQARKLSPRIVEGIQATKSAISSGTNSGSGSTLALQELSGHHRRHRALWRL
jgi:hypothetical protein